MELTDCSSSIQIVPGDPLVMQVVVTPPFDKVFNTAVMDFLFLFLFFISFIDLWAESMIVVTYIVSVYY